MHHEYVNHSVTCCISKFHDNGNLIASLNHSISTITFWEIVIKKEVPIHLDFLFSLASQIQRLPCELLSCSPQAKSDRHCKATVASLNSWLYIFKTAMMMITVQALLRRPVPHAHVAESMFLPCHFLEAPSRWGLTGPLWFSGWGVYRDDTNDSPSPCSLQARDRIFIVCLVGFDMHLFETPGPPETAAQQIIHTSQFALC